MIVKPEAQMSFGFLHGSLYSVDEVIKTPALDGEIIAVNGVFYSGPEAPDSEFVLLSKHGWFDATGVADVKFEGKQNVITINDPLLATRINSHIASACGEFLHKYDCMIVGRVQKDSASGFGASIREVNLLVLTSWREGGPKQHVYVLSFPERGLPPLPWTSPVNRNGMPVLEMSTA
jgi:hypothetical protein